ncbi:uncharacterized protein LOC132304241 [Cornus florida]|uniref:uncharacterized protein LOC132304241 n=1 Tax=Cornus florida TaxID=4283 RepID=UPI0028A13539|nr:uncharacterized protein LOC132304241 [Cornus florida]XP_059657807.1 uncharacterized protein LOC132304241 [Cornus florida]XP_059657808.1 uncharacterized protein LOC132304241 [Cornus florida]
MIASMDLNASPQTEKEKDDETFEPHLEEGTAPEHIGNVEHTESAVEIYHREREERRQRLKRECSDDRPMHASQPPMHDQMFQAKRQRFYDKNKLPPGWLDCPAAGQEINFIIPSKVPLGDFFNDCVASGKRYSVRQAIRQQSFLGRKLGLVIDLTNTSRYYPASDWKKEGIKYVKIRCKGRDSVPANEAVNYFVYEVSQFLDCHKHSKHILVHCTHGHNRTGYMIVHYLKRTQSISVTQAIEKFAKERPPGIYKADYIDALYNFYHEIKPELVSCPPTPEWKKSSDLDLNGDAVTDDDDNGGPAAPLHENNEIDIVMTNDDVLGDNIPFDQQESMRQFCYQSLKLSVGARGNSQFPGSHPVSLSRGNLQLLRQHYYYATWKADGTRYMMLITMDGCYLIDRHFNFRRVQMRFPCKNTKTHHYTLLDGEMIIDTLPGSQKQERRYLIYDLMAINNDSVIEWPFHERWKMIENEVIEPRNYERFPTPDKKVIEPQKYECWKNMNLSRNPYYRYDLEPFRVRRKDFWLLSTVNKLLMEFIPRLSHAADGLIFQDWDDPYVPRTHEGLLKWKYMNSVDFLFEMIDNRQLLFLHERGKKKLMEGNRVVFSDDSDPLLYSGKIVECSWDSEKNVWVYMRTRIDKGTPNDFNTYKKVMRSINDNITEDLLLNEIHEIIRLPIYAHRIQHDSKAYHHPHGNKARMMMSKAHHHHSNFVQRRCRVE